MTATKKINIFLFTILIIMIDWKKIYKSTDIDWLKSIITKGLLIKNQGLSNYVKIPAASRYAAMRLYELGERPYAFEVLINQLLKYKKSDIPLSTKYETCVDAMIALGQLGDKGAVGYLLEAIDQFTDVAAFSLSLIGGDDLEKILFDLTKEEGIRAFGATLSLGFLSNVGIIPRIEEILNNTERYSEIYRGKLVWHLREIIMYILGNYENERVAKIFERNIDKSIIRQFVMDFLINEERSSYFRYIDITTLGWRIFQKYNWKKHIRSANYDRIAEGLITEVVDEIWDEIEGMKRFL